MAMFFSSIIDVIPFETTLPTVKTYPIDYNIVYYVGITFALLRQLFQVCFQL
jgi:lipoprotein-releasing system permease protein